MTRLTTYTIHLISGLLLALLTAGCVADRNVSDCVAEGDEVEIEFALKVPALETSLRQLSEKQESQVNSVKVLVFNTQDAAGQTLAEEDETFAYVAKMTTTNFIPDQDGVTHVVCKLTAFDKPMRIVCIANYDVPESILTVGTAKKTILEHTQMMMNFTGKWPTSGDKYHIPMWGESDAQPVNKGTRFNSCAKLAYGNAGQNRNNEGVIHLVRALARVDVGVNFEADPSSQTAAGDENFKIMSVRVYRYATSMYVAGTQATAFNFDGGRRNAIPHTPEGVQAAKDKDPLVFTATTDEDAKGYIRNIYIPEIENKTKTKNERICLVVGGEYNKSGKQTYYRVDFMRTETNASGEEITEQLDILRNYRYRFNITKIAGPGTDTPEEALTTEHVNIAYDCLVWDDGKVDKIVYDGQYYLAVSKDKFDFGRSEGDEPFTVRTNWEGGYKFVNEKGEELPKSKEEAEDKGMWYYLSDPKDPAFVKDQDFDEKVFVLENGTGAARSAAKGSIFVQAGRIKWPLKINQSNKIAVYIRLYELVDGKRIPTNLIEIKKGETKTVEVEYTPGANLERRVTDAGSQFIWTRTDDGSVFGKAVYEITPDESRIDEDTFNLIAVARFRADLEGMVASADLTLTLNVYNAIPYRFGDLHLNMLKSTENGYVLDNREQKFYIKANAPYQLIIESIQTSPTDIRAFQDKVVRGWNAHTNNLVHESVGHLSGDCISFTPYDYTFGETGIKPGDVTIAKISLKIVSTDPQKKFDTKRFTILLASSIIQPTANCYIIKRRAQLPILIPVSEQINKAAEWYEQFETVMEATVKQRADASSGDDNGFAYDVYNKYLDDGASKLTRLEPTDDDWEVACLWSTIDHFGAGPGLTFKKVQIDGFGKRNFMSVAVDPNSDDIGSAVLVVKRPGNDGEILWSWHIWVVDNYPWEPLRSGLASPLPFMNRNLGARYQRADRDPSYDPNQAGMYYQFGRKDPFHPYDQATGKGVKLYENRTLRYTNPTMQRSTLGNPKTISRLPQHKLQILFDMASAKAFWRMKDFVRDPSGMGYRAGTFSNAMEWGPWEFRNEAGNTAWQGTTAVTTYMETSRRICTNTTIKTPFDPSPYGWKVPAVGRESNYAKSRGFYPAASGCFPKGNIEALEWVSNTNRYSAYSVSTRINVRDINPGIQYDYSTSGMNYNMLEGANPSAAIPVRCRVNENELDYKAFTEEGFFQRR